MSDGVAQLDRTRLIELVRAQSETIARLEARIERLEQDNAQLKEQIARLKRDSSNSAKPPSSDIAKPDKGGSKSKRGQKRKIGGQPGHRRHERRSFAADEIDQVQHHALDHCPDCGGELEKIDASAKVVQQVELIERPIRVTEHRAASQRCSCCGQTHRASLPATVERGGLFGPRLTALAGHLKGAGHHSYSTIHTFFDDVLGIQVSRGQLCNTIKKASAALGPAYHELVEALPQQARLNIDESGHKDNGKRMWTWCFRAADYTLFKIEPSRGSKVLTETLGEAFAGVIGCDYFSAYRKYMGDCDVKVQFCLAHLIREVKFLTEHPEPAARTYGQRLLDTLRELFRVFHSFDPTTGARFTNALQRRRDKVVMAAQWDVPDVREARNLAKRFQKHGKAYFQFITTAGTRQGKEGIGPTNNLAEQAIRFVVIDRKITQGTRGDAGQKWCQRIWTTLATCAQQNRSAFAFLTDAVQAHLQGRHPPSLMPCGP